MIAGFASDCPAGPRDPFKGRGKSLGERTMKLSADFWRHVLIGAAGAGATMIQLGIQVATEGLNQALAAGR
jgi:hypothetical protein